MDHTLIYRAKTSGRVLEKRGGLLGVMGRKALVHAGVGAVGGAAGSWMGGGDVGKGALTGAVAGGLGSLAMTGARISAASNAASASRRIKPLNRSKVSPIAKFTVNKNIDQINKFRASHNLAPRKKYKVGRYKSLEEANPEVYGLKEGPPDPRMVERVKSMRDLQSNLAMAQPYVPAVLGVGTGYMTANPAAAAPAPQIQAYGSANFLEPDFIEKQAQIRMFRANNRGN